MKTNIFLLCIIACMPHASFAGICDYAPSKLVAPTEDEDEKPDAATTGIIAGTSGVLGSIGAAILAPLVIIPASAIAAGVGAYEGSCYLSDRITSAKKAAEAKAALKNAQTQPSDENSVETATETVVEKPTTTAVIEHPTPAQPETPKVAVTPTVVADKPLEPSATATATIETKTTTPDNQAVMQPETPKVAVTPTVVADKPTEPSGALIADENKTLAQPITPENTLKTVPVDNLPAEKPATQLEKDEKIEKDDKVEVKSPTAVENKPTPTVEANAPTDSAENADKAVATDKSAEMPAEVSAGTEPKSPDVPPMERQVQTHMDDSKTAETNTAKSSDPAK